MSGASLTPALARQVDAICSAFETAWQAGQRPALEECLRDAPAEARTLLLGELLVLDVAYRRRRGEEPNAAEYHARFPECTAPIHAAFQRTADMDQPDEITITPVTRSTDDQPTRPPSDPLLPPTWPSVPGYEILDEVAVGGMGVVYKARQVEARRVVALKMIRDGALARPEYRDRFRIEIEAAARLSHPNVIRIYDVGEHAGLPFFTMEYAEGGNLAARLRQGPLDPRVAAELLRTLAEAVQHAHQKDIIHRDLKPGNVVLTADGRPLITDFGLAKRLDHQTDVTPSAAVLGTAGYMSPEQAEGKTKHALPPVDIYGLGAVLYELLTGRPPFVGESFQAVVRQVIQDDPEAPTRLRPNVPTELEAICLHCLEKAPAERYPTAQALADDLGCWLRGEPLSVVPITEWDRQARWARQAGFEVDDVLTYGVHDIVWRARQEHLNRVVALKVFAAPADAEEQDRERFRREARTVARLDHPNIVRIYSSGELKGRTFLAFEYIDGGNLIERFVDRPVPPREAAEMVRQLADATHYAHQRGVLHCALKPSNVLLTTEGVPKIANFGLSVLLEEPAAERRLPFRRLPSYMSPELAEGRLQDVSPASDVYALGAILYKLLTGGPPFLGETLEETLEMVRRQPVRPPSALQPDVPRLLGMVCLKCLEKAPGRRYASAGELAEALGAFLAGKLPARNPVPSESVAIPGYEVIQELGRGSLSIVYEARHVATGRTVALKALLKNLYYGEDLIALLRDVAERVVQLRHPNIVDIYECGEHDGRPYFSMELLTRSLDCNPTGTRLPTAEAAALLRTLARMLDAVHQKGIVHGNLKPSKVLFTADGTPKVTGFIISRQDVAMATAGQMAVTMQGAVMGTPSYMAPEQLSGEPATVGHAADIYALGLILYEVLTGWQPFRAATLWEMIRQVLSQAPEPPSRLRSDLPPDLETICLRCLEKEPAKRYPGGGALADALDCFLACKPLPQDPPTAPLHSSGSDMSSKPLPPTPVAVPPAGPPVGFWSRLFRWFKRGSGT